MAVPSDDSCAELLAGLNEEQRAAVTHEGNPLLVLAGCTFREDDDALLAAGVAGTGAGVSPERILLGGTFHSVARRTETVTADLAELWR